MEKYYKEDIQSINLMKLNKIYLDAKFENTENFVLKKIFLKLKDISQAACKIKKYGIRKTFFIIYCKINKNKLKDYQLQYCKNDLSELCYKTSEKKISGKIAVYTAVFGDYDKIKEPLFVSEFCDYFAITDQELKKDSIWKKIDLDKNQEFQNLDNYHKAKYCKMFPHKIFPQYEYSIWLDGNVIIVADLFPLVDRMTNSYIAAFNHPQRDCIYTEANSIIEQNSASIDLLEKQIKFYKDEKFPKHYGMRELSIIVREHNNKECKQLMDKWWEQVNTYTMRDQISLPYILWKSGKKISTIQLLGDTWRWNLRFVEIKHKKKNNFN